MMNNAQDLVHALCARFSVFSRGKGWYLNLAKCITLTKHCKLLYIKAVEA